MEIKKKELYQIPLTEALKIKTEGVICLSGDINASMDGTFTEEILSDPGLGI